ncbi:MAG: hypothetical protein A2027_02775 [Thermodesulfovibrio sp. RBG_19FT_COMBO_41_18]|nr:MAG: hypothetical protein A2027_02775 [Thermodesulfovibrio sp. RBG_19FT_COMBO_41_18]
MSLVGRLEDIALSDIFQILSIGRKTGTLVLKGSRGNALIVFKNGLVVRAETDDIDRTLGEDLLNAGIIKDTIFHLASGVKKKLPAKSIPEILYEFGSINKDALEKITRKRIEKVVCQLLFWQDGDFQFELDDIDPKGKVEIPDHGWELSKGMSPEYLLVEGARVHDESSQTRLVSTEELTGFKREEVEWEGEWEVQPPPVERKDISSLRALTQELRFPNSASEITLLILRFASDIFLRGILFMVGDREIVGLGQFGLDIEKPDEKIREIILLFEESNFLNKIIMEKRPYKGSIEKDRVTEELINEIDGGWPGEAALFPLIAEGRVVALLYCDNLTTGEKIIETEGLEIFIDQAGLALEKSLLQRRIQEMENKPKR